MLHKIKFSNFYSFHDEITIDLEVNKRAPNTDAYIITPAGLRVSKLMAFIGANASGKTNLLKCISFMDWFIRLSFFEPADEPLPFKPFLLQSKIQPSSFLIEFEVDGKIYNYHVVMTNEKVISEKLNVKSHGKKPRKLFSRIWDEHKKNYKLDLQNFKLPAGFSKLLRPNVSIISTGIQVQHSESIKIGGFFDTIWSNISEIGKIPLEQQKDTLEYYLRNPRMRAKAEEILTKFDFGLSKIKIQQYEDQEKRSAYRAYGVHKFIDSNEEMPLPFTYESSGTRNLLSLLKVILTVLNSGGIAVIDEMEHDLHPLMINEIVNLFTSQIYNPLNAQLLFSTHTAQVINKLDKQQIIIVEKNNSVSSAFSLQDIKGVKADDNFYAKYIAGAYGGIPRL